MNPSLEQHWMQRARFLTQALILSGTLNIGFLGASLYWALQDKFSSFSYEVPVKAKSQFTNEQVLRAYSKASFQDLLVRLESKEFVEEGYTKRDLALACLCAFHHLDIEKALGSTLLQKRLISFRNEQEQEIVDLVAFAGLKEEHFQALLEFVRREKWPLTSKGLFFELVRSSDVSNSSLFEAFSCTAEFRSIYSLLQKGIPDFTPLALLRLLKEGSWQQIKIFSDRLRVFQSYDLATFRDFLTSYALESHSKMASYFLLVYEADYVLKRFDDEKLLTFLGQLEAKSAKAMALQLLVSPRSDSVRKKAAYLLYESEGLPIPESYSYVEALQCFVPSLEKKEPQPAVKEPEIVACSIPQVKPLTHKVQEGESLWKISRKYGVSIEAIMKLNGLESDRLRPGRDLQIPDKKP